MKYRSEIDGLRAVAVVPVVLFHAGLEAFGGGFVGVDVFFVISGYLITTIIIDEMDGGAFSLVRFYERRARRILPALFFVALCSIPVAWFLLLPSDMKDFAQSLAAVATFSSNILFWRESGYFDIAAELKPLLHTWSLAVEEQFYILFPLFLMAAWRLGRRTIVWMLTASFAISLAAAQWGAYNGPSATFFLLPTRAWELLIGSFCAFYLQRNQIVAPLWFQNLMSVSGLAAILYAVFVFDEATPFPGIYALVPTVGTVLIILFALPGTFVHAFLSLRGMVGLGLISYSFYLWHQPVFAFWRHYSFLETTHVQMLLLSGLSVLLAVFTYFFVEAPFRGKTAVLDRRQLFSASGIGLVALLAVGVIGGSREDLSRTIVYPLDYEPDRIVLRDESWSLFRVLGQDSLPGDDESASNQLSLFSEADVRHKLLVFGNSHSKDMFNVLHYSSSASERFQLARYGTQIWQLDEDFFQLSMYNKADVVMIVSRYGPRDYDAMPRHFRRIIADGKVLVVVPNIFEFFDTGRFTLADIYVQRCLQQAACDYGTLEDRINRSYFQEVADDGGGNPYFESLRVVDGLRARWNSIVVLDRMDYVCDPAVEQCYAMDERFNKYFYDYGHHTLVGARFFAGEVDEEDWLAPVLDALDGE